MNSICWSVTLLCVAANSALGQSFGNPAGLAADTPGVERAQPAPDHANAQDQLFARQSVLGGQMEVELGKLAQQRAMTSSARDFATRMIEDHGKANSQMQRLARSVKAEMPKEPDPEHRTIRRELEQVSRSDFDAAYLAVQIQNHQKTVNLLLWEISNGQHEGLKKYASDALPVVMTHLEMAQLHHAQLLSAPAT